MLGFSEVFQNYIWVPIISAIVGGLLSLGVPKLYKIISNRIKKAVYKSSDEISIAGEWNSFFHEENVLQTESVTLEQEGQLVTGKIKMRNTSPAKEYNFTGEFKNQILIGSYESSNRRKYERGTIAVRRITEDVLSGYCTFVYQDRQVYNSPYILSTKASHDIEKGTYSFCNTCVGRFDCCCNCKDIDMPILLPFEVNSISEAYRKPKEEFASKLTNNLYQMKRREDKEENGCVFFINNSCSIYKDRPLDCRLFPFDFKEIDNTYWLIYYNDINVCKALPKSKKEIEICAHSIRPILDMILPYMSECSDPIFCRKLSKQNYQKLFPISKVRDDSQ